MEIPGVKPGLLMIHCTASGTDGSSKRMDGYPERANSGYANGVNKQSDKNIMLVLKLTLTTICRRFKTYKPRQLTIMTYNLSIQIDLPRFVRELFKGKEALYHQDDLSHTSNFPAKKWRTENILFTKSMLYESSPGHNGQTSKLVCPFYS